MQNDWELLHHLLIVISVLSPVRILVKTCRLYTPNWWHECGCSITHESKEDPNLCNSANFKYIYEIAEVNLHNNNLKVTQQWVRRGLQSVQFYQLQIYLWNCRGTSPQQQFEGNRTMSQKKVLICTILQTSNLSMKWQRKISTRTIWRFNNNECSYNLMKVAHKVPETISPPSGTVVMSCDDSWATSPAPTSRCTHKPSQNL